MSSSDDGFNVAVWSVVWRELEAAVIGSSTDVWYQGKNWRVTLMEGKDALDDVLAGVAVRMALASKVSRVRVSSGSWLAVREA